MYRDIYIYCTFLQGSKILLHCFKKSDHDSFVYPYLHLKYWEKSNLNIIFTFITKSTKDGDEENEREHFKNTLNQLRVKESCDAVIVMGDVNPDKLFNGLPFVNKQSELPSSTGSTLEHADKCFNAYMRMIYILHMMW